MFMEHNKNLDKFVKHVLLLPKVEAESVKNTKVCG